MRLNVFFGTAVYVFFAGALTIGAQANAQDGAPLSMDQVAAILATPKAGSGVRLTESLSVTGSGFAVTIFSPQSWVKNAQNTAASEQRTFALDNVTDEMRRDVWRVHAEPDMPTKITGRCFSVAHTIIGNKSGTVTVQPTLETPFDVTVQNPGGATMMCHGLDAEYRTAPILELWGKNRDQKFWVSAIGDRGSVRYDFEIKEKHFAALK